MFVIFPSHNELLELVIKRASISGNGCTVPILGSSAASYEALIAVSRKTHYTWYLHFPRSCRPEQRMLWQVASSIIAYLYNQLGQNWPVRQARSLLLP